MTCEEMRSYYGKPMPTLTVTMDRKQRYGMKGPAHRLDDVTMDRKQRYGMKDR